MNHDCIIYCIFLVHTYISTKKLTLIIHRYTKCKIMLPYNLFPFSKGGGGNKNMLISRPPPPGNKLFLISRGGVVLMPANFETCMRNLYWSLFHKKCTRSFKSGCKRDLAVLSGVCRNCMFSLWAAPQRRC